MLLQRWRDVAFVHWRFEPDEIGRLLPVGLTVDLYQDGAWVTLTPFGVDGSRPPFLPSVPGLSNFVESNLRTYVIGPDGRDGIWFFTLETNSLATTIAARTALGVPYRWAAMELRRAGDQITYSSRRRMANPRPWHRTTVAMNPTGQIADSPLAEWLTGGGGRGPGSRAASSRCQWSTSPGRSPMASSSRMTTPCSPRSVYERPLKSRSCTPRPV